MRIKIISDALKVTERVANQIRFATARALTESAIAAKINAQQNVGKHFENHRSAWIEKGFIVISASKAKLTAVVGHWERAPKSDHDFLKRQVEGGTKSPKGKQQAIPHEGAAFAGPGGGVTMPRGTHGERATYRGSNWPLQLIKQIEKAQKQLDRATNAKDPRSRKAGARAYRKNRSVASRLVFLEHAKIPTIAVRVASGNGKGKYQPLWFLKKGSVKIKARYPFHAEAEAVVSARLSPLFNQFVEKYAGDVRIP